MFSTLCQSEFKAPIDIFHDWVKNMVYGGFVLGPCFLNVILCVHSIFAIILLRKRLRELVALLCVFAVLWLSVFCVSSVWCREFVSVVYN